MTEILCPTCQSVAVNAQDENSLFPFGSFYYCVPCTFSFRVEAMTDLTLDNGKEDEYWTRLDEERNEVIFEGVDSEGWMELN